MAEQDHAVDVLEFGAGVGKVLADVAERGRSEEGVADGVQQYVGVAVPLEAHGVWNLHSADYQFSAADELVYVDSHSYAHDVLNSGFEGG